MEQKFGKNSILGRAKRPSRADIEVLRSFLCITPQQLSRIRRAVTFGDKIT